MGALTKKQRDNIYKSNPGYGYIVFNNGDGITEIEVYVGSDHVMRRVANGQLLFPIQILDEEDGLVNVLCEE